MQIIGNKVTRIKSGELQITTTGTEKSDNSTFDFVISNRVRDNDTVTITISIAINSVMAGENAHLDVETEFLLTVNGDLSDVFNEENIELMAALVIISVDHARALFADKSKDSSHSKNLVPIPKYNDILETLQLWAGAHTF